MMVEKEKKGMEFKSIEKEAKNKYIILLFELYNV